MEKKDASIIYKYLKEIADQLRQVRSDFSKDLSVSALMICEEYKNKFEDKGFEIDYLEIINAKNLEKSKKDDTDLLIAIAVHFKGVRLIDNLPCDLSFS